MPAHSDIIDLFLFLAAPAVLALGVIFRRLPRRGLALFGTLTASLVLMDSAGQLPFPDAFPLHPDGSATLVPDVVMALYLAAALGFVAVALAPPAAAWPMACLMIAPMLSIIIFTTNAVAACNLYIHHDGIAREALARAGEQVAALGILAGVVFAAADEGKGGPWQVVPRAAVAGVLGLCSILFGWSTPNFVLAVLAALVPFVALLPVVRRGFGSWVALNVGWGRVAWLSGSALLALLALGVGASLAGNWRNASSGWVPLPGLGAVLPLTAVYFLFPLFLGSLATAPAKLPGLADRWQVVPGWAALGFAASAATIGCLMIQGESGISVLVAVATVAWWLASSGRVRPTLLVLAGATLAALVGILYVYSSPAAFAAASDSIYRLSWVVFGPTDGRMDQFNQAWQLVRDAGWWGTGLRDPGGPLNVPAWTNDFLATTAARFLGVCGATGLILAAVLPAGAAARGAVDEPFNTDADRARPAALFTVPWVVLWGGGALWISAGSMLIWPLSGLTMGLASPSLNHLLWTLPAVAWMAARSVARSEPSTVPMEGLRFALHACALGLIAACTTLIINGWGRLVDRDDAWVLPITMSGTNVVVADGRGIRLGEGEGDYVDVGHTFKVDRLTLRVGSGPSIEVVSIHVDADDLDDGFHLGLPGRNAPLHIDGMGFPDRIAFGNHVWLESRAETRYRELTLRRAGSQVFAIAPMDDSAIEVIGLDGTSCAAEDAGDYCPVTDGARVGIRGTYEFAAHISGLDVEFGWLEGAPEPRLVEGERPLRLGDRTLAPMELADQVWVREARAELGLLGLTGALYVEDGILKVGPEPTVPPDATASEAAIYAAAKVAYRVWFDEVDPKHGCHDNWGWADDRDPLNGGKCVAGAWWDSDAKENGYYLGRLRFGADGRVVDVRSVRTKVLDVASHPEASAARGQLWDRYGTPLFGFVAGDGWQAVEPWLAWLGEREIAARDVKPGRPEYGTRTVTRSSGLQKVFQPVLSGQYAQEGPWAQLWRRLRRSPAPGGADIITTLSLPLMREVAKAVEAQARTLAETASRLGPGRQAIEHRGDCRAYPVHAVVTGSDGGILAAMTAVGMVAADGTVTVIWESSANKVECLCDFSGPLRALSEPLKTGSTQKVWTYALAIDAALAGDPRLQWEEKDGELWLLDAGDPDNGDGQYMLGHTGVERVYGVDVPDCGNYKDVDTGPIRFIKGFAFSDNGPACLLAALENFSGDRIGPVVRALQLDGALDILNPIGDVALDRARLPSGTFAVGGHVPALNDGKVTIDEATKMPLGKHLSPTALGNRAAMSAAGTGGMYAPPFLILGARLADGTEHWASPPSPTRVFSKEAAAWTVAASKATVQMPGATGFSTMETLDPVQHDNLGLKSGTADVEAIVNGKKVSLPSPKSAVALYPLDSASPVTISVWCGLAQGLNDRAANEVVRDIVASGALETSVVTR